MQDEQNKRPWQFSIRDVLLIMLIVALAVGWFVDHRRLAELSRQQQQSNWVWLGGAKTNQSDHASLLLLNAAVDSTPPAFVPPEPDETITDPPPVTPDL
jgi:hypothetical protein